MKLSTILVSTTESGNPSYLPYILTFDAASFGVESSGNLGAISSMGITLARNATTDQLLAAASFAQLPVDIDAAFFASPIAAADLTPVARMVLSSIIQADQATIQIQLLNDERKLSRIPKNKISDTALVVPKESKLLPLPILIGDFRRSDGGTSSQDEPYHARFGDYAPCFLADELLQQADTYPGTNPPTTNLSKTNIGKYIASENDIGAGNDVVINEVFEYNSNLELQTKIGTVDSANQDAFTWRGDNIQSEPYVPAGSWASRIRLTYDRNLYRLGEEVGIENELNDTTGATSFIWKNATDDNQSNFAELRLAQNPVRTKLAIGFQKQFQPSTIASGINVANGSNLWDKLYYFFTVTSAEKTAGGGTRLSLADAFIIHPTDSTKNLVYLGAPFTQDITGATTLPQTFFFGPINGIGPIMSSGPYSGTQVPSTLLGWAFENLMLKLTISGVTSAAGQFANIKSFGIEIVYRDQGASFKKANNFFLSPGGRKFRRIKDGRFIFPDREVTDIQAASHKNIFCDITGPRSFAASPANPDGLIFTHPVFMIAGLLCDVLGYSYSEIDGPGFKKAQDFYPTDEMSVFIDQEEESVDALRSICEQANLILFKSSSGVWKLMPRNAYLTAAPVTAFGDQKQDYIVSNLRVKKIEPLYNKFTVQYQYDFARNVWGGTAVNDFSGTFPNGRPMTPTEAKFIRKTTSANNLATRLRDFYGKSHREVSFASSAAATALEIGDYITVEHAALLVEAPLPKYQITEISYGIDSVNIQALEVTG